MKIQVVYLDVPYRDKDEAKKLGAKWDPEERKWYVPPTRQIEDFSKWMEECDE